MIDYTEIINWEQFEELAEMLLNADGLRTRRLGRGPGQSGKDIIAWEPVGGTLSGSEKRKWLVECKFSIANSSIGENEVYNVYDRVKSQEAYGYFLFTNRRLKVNLEKTLNELKSNIGIIIWTSQIIAEKTMLYENIFRKYFPNSFVKWIQQNRLVYLNQMKSFRSPLGYILSYLYLMRDAPIDKLTYKEYQDILNYIIPILIKFIDHMDEQLRIIYQTTTNKTGL